MADPRLEQALRDLETTAANAALRLCRTANVRQTYVRKIGEMSKGILESVNSGALTPKVGAELAHEMRNQIMEMSRQHDFDVGRAYAKALKKAGLSFEEAIQHAMAKLGFGDKAFGQLSAAQRDMVFRQVIESSGHSRPAVTQTIGKLRNLGRAAWVATILIAIYEIGTAENPWWQTGRSSANIAGGIGGSMAAGALAGVWAGPVGVAVGALVGGLVGALLADHAYVQAAGTSDPITREFVARFTSLWTGTDEEGIAAALAREHDNDLAFIARVFGALNHDYSTDADDVAVAFVQILQKNPALARSVRANSALRELLIQLMDDGWTTADEYAAIKFLQGS